MLRIAAFENACMVWQSLSGFGPMPLHEEREARRLLQSARFRHGNLTRVGLSSDLDPKSPFDNVSYEISCNESSHISVHLLYHNPTSPNISPAMAQRFSPFELEGGARYRFPCSIGCTTWNHSPSSTGSKPPLSWTFRGESSQRALSLVLSELAAS